MPLEPLDSGYAHDPVATRPRSDRQPFMELRALRTRNVSEGLLDVPLALVTDSADADDAISRLIAARLVDLPLQAAAIALWFCPLQRTGPQVGADRAKNRTHQDEDRERVDCTVSGIDPRSLSSEPKVGQRRDTRSIRPERPECWPFAERSSRPSRMTTERLIGRSMPQIRLGCSDRVSTSCPIAAGTITDSFPLAWLDDEDEFLPLIIRKAFDEHPHGPVVPDVSIADVVHRIFDSLGEATSWLRIDWIVPEAAGERTGASDPRITSLN